MLARLPAGASVFIDTNIFLYHLLDLNPSCTELFHRVQRRDLRGYTSTAVLSEVCHHLMLGEIGERHAVTPGGALRLLRQHPELIPTLTKAAKLIEQIRRWRLRVVPVRWREFSVVPEIYQRFRLLTNDALIVATMRRHRLIHLVSNDTDFASVPGIALWRP